MTPFSGTSEQTRPNEGSSPGVSDQSGGALHFAEVFGKSAVRSAVIEPVNGVAQLVSEGANVVTSSIGLGKVLPEVGVWQRPTEVKFGSSDWFAQSLGSGIGMVVPFLATDTAVGKLLGGKTGVAAELADQSALAREVAPLMQPALSGAAYGAIFTPTDTSHNAFEQRAVNAFSGGLTFGAQKAATLALTRGLTEVGVSTAGNSLKGTVARVGANMFGGTVAGAVGAESNSLLNGNGFASKDELTQSVATFVVMGGTLELAHTGIALLSKTHVETPKPAAQQVDSATIGGDNTHIMDVQHRMDSDGAKTNSDAMIAQKTALTQNLNDHIEAVFGSDQRAALQKQQFAGLVEQVAVREHDGVGMPTKHLSQTFDSVEKLLSTDKLVVPLTAEERLGLAKQILTQAGKPHNITFGTNNTAEAMGLEGLLMDRVPGKLSSAIVALLTTGKYVTNRADAITVDLSPETLEALPTAYRNPLSPDLEARQSLADAIDGKPHNGENRSYLSQLNQLLLNNIATQSQAEPCIYVKGPSDTLSNDTGERLFKKEPDGSYDFVRRDGEIVNNVGLKVPDLQPIFDHVSGVDNDSLVLKNGNFFLVTNTDGLIGSGRGGSRFGFYGNDSRFLNQWDVKLNGEAPKIESIDVEKGYAGKFEYTNAQTPDLAADAVKLTRDVVINDNVATERINLSNKTELPQTVHLTVGVGSEFADMFEVRGWSRNERGVVNEPIVAPEGGRILLSYKGLDGATLYTDISANGNGEQTQLSKDGVHFTVTLPPGADRSVELAIKPGITTDAEPDLLKDATPAASHAEQLQKADKDYDDWRARGTSVESDNEDFNKVMDRAYRDLYMLRISTPHGDGIAAGIPWYVCGFGRDQLVVSLQTLPFHPELTKGVLMQLAANQGKEFNTYTAEKPGGIMHELRVGEMARNKEIPFTPYFGTTDAPPLYLIVLGKYVQMTGDKELAEKLKPTTDALLDYYDREIMRNGYLAYGGSTKEALSNQGWKDSGDSIMHEDGTLLKGPITLAEPQGYLYQAWREAAKIADLQGDSEKAELLNKKAADLKERFNRDFWMPDKNFIALALDGDGNQAKVIASNPGHLLSTGILDPDKAQIVTERLMEPDMHSGYGIRTLSSGEVRYNPVSYHNGTLWWHDNSMIGAGVHDLTPEKPFAAKLIGSMFDAAIKYPGFRLPELSGGYPRATFPNLIPYPEMSNPQAWAAGAMFQMTTSTLGVHPNGLDNSLLVFKPTLPPIVNALTMYGLRVGQNPLDIKFERDGDTTKTTVLSNPGNVTIKSSLELHQPAEDATLQTPTP